MGTQGISLLHLGIESHNTFPMIVMVIALVADFIDTHIASDFYLILEPQQENIEDHRTYSTHLGHGCHGNPSSLIDPHLTVLSPNIFQSTVSLFSNFSK